LTSLFINRSSVIFLLLCFLFISRMSLACSLSIGLSSDFPPYHTKSADQNWTGITVDLASILVKTAGCDLQIIELPWARSIKLLESGDIQLISHFTYTLDRAKYTQFLGPHHIEKIAFIANSHVSKEVNSPEFLPLFNGKIGLTRGDKFCEKFDQYVLNNDLVNIKLVDIRNNRDRASMLFKGRLEAMFYDEMSAQYLLASNPLLNDKYAIRFTLQGSPVYWGVSYRFVSNEVREALNRAWHYMLEHNMIEPVYLKYGLHIDVQQLTNFPVLLLNSENK
jgi:polar amino acid transport system substrate-binding protein